MTLVILAWTMQEDGKRGHHRFYWRVRVTDTETGAVGHSRSRSGQHAADEACRFACLHADAYRLFGITSKGEELATPSE